MIIGIKDIFKMIGIVIISACAVFISALFMNFNIDIADVEELLSTPVEYAFYDAQVMVGKLICILAGGCLMLTSVVVMCFYIKNYIDTHRKELGILKAMGYSEFRVARGFWVFGLNVFVGTALGYLGAHLVMPKFYQVQNAEEVLPAVSISFHPMLFGYIVVLPMILFAAISVIYGYLKLKVPVMDLLRGQKTHKIKPAKKDTDLPFLDELRRNTVRQRKSLVFFIGFASLCYAAMIQMSYNMKDLASVMMSIMMVLIGIVLAVTTLFLATTTVIKANSKNFAMMKAFGYSSKESAKAVLGGYRSIAYIGFFIGTIYQYAIMKFMTKIVLAELEYMNEVNFDVRAFFIALISFLFVYEVIMTWYTRKIGKISIKEIMMDGE